MRTFPLFRILLIVLCHIAQSSELTLQSASSSHVNLARGILLKNAMNPLSLSKERLLVAVENDEVVGFGQIRALDDTHSELASLYVMPDHRRKGVATKLISELLDRHDQDEPTKDVCLLTLKPTMHVYELQNFEELHQDVIPSSMKFEFAVGTKISAVLGNDLVCMIRRRDTENRVTV